MSQYNTTTSQVTISLLPVTLSLVHIPRSRVPELSRPIIKQLLQFNSPFLNLTCNEIELSIFAEDDMRREFEPIAWRDRQRVQRARSGSKPSASASVGHRKRRLSALDSVQPVEISLERWNVLQIDSHEDSSNSGARVRELSSPLAEAGISILYQSSYMSDFIFVKATRLNEVMSLLGDAGFGLYSSDPHNLISQMSPLLTPADSDDNASSMTDFSVQDDLTSSSHVFSPTRFSSESGAVLSRTRSSTCSSSVDLASMALAASQEASHEYALDDTHDHEETSNSSSPAPTSISPSSASTATMTSPESLEPSVTPDRNTRAIRQARKALSPTAAPVDILAPDLACVGLSEQSADSWSLKIVKLVAFPELIYPPAKSLPSPSSPVFDADEPQATPIPSGRDQKELVRPLEDSDGYFSSMTSSFGNNSGSDSSNDNDSEDEYFSSSPYSRHRDDVSASTPSLISGSSRRSSRSYPDIDVAFNRLEAPLSHLARPDVVEKESALSLTRPDRLDRDEEDVGHESDILEYPRRKRSAGRNHTESNTVSFFSFTRTAEGSSLTTDVRLLAALFPPPERHMLIGRDELLEAADRLAIADNRIELDPDLFYTDDSEYARSAEAGAFKCLQIDLHKFGLDKHGLVNRFSRVLEENGINHMYSSTYKTANLLVDKSNAVRAQSLLRSC